MNNNINLYNQNSQMPKMMTIVDPYVVQTLQTVLGKYVVVDTNRGTIRGKLVDVKPDHVVLQEANGDSTFFIRIQQIIWVMPE